MPVYPPATWWYSRITAACAGKASPVSIRSRTHIAGLPDGLLNCTILLSVSVNPDAAHGC